MSEATIRSPTVPKTRLCNTEFVDNSPMNSSLWMLVIGLVLATALDGMDLMSASFAMPGVIKDFKLNQPWREAFSRQPTSDWPWERS